MSVDEYQSVSEEETGLFHRPLSGAWGFVLLLALAALACGGIGPAPEEESWTPVPAGGEGTVADPGPTATDVPSAASESPGSAAVGDPGSAGTVELVEAPAGRACLGTRSGVTCLAADGTWQSYTRENSPLGGNSIYATDVCPDGTIALGHISGVSLLGEDGWREVPDEWDGGSIEDLACAAGELWVVHFRGASRFDGSWRTFPSSELSTDPDAGDLVNGVALAPNGDPWVATAAGVARFDGNSWEIIEEGNGFPERLFVEDVAVDAGGGVWILHSRGLVIYRDGAWRFDDAPSLGVSYEDLAVDDQDQAWMGTLSDGVVAYAGGAWVSFSRESGDLPSNEINDVAVDARGRIWAATSYGLAVYDGTSWRTYQMHSAPLLDNTIESVAVVDGGPVLPAPERAAAGALSGRLLDRDGVTALAGAAVEICPENVAFLSDGEPPCDGQPLVLRAESGSDGTFLLENVPPGLYTVSIESAPGAWGTLTGELGFNERVLVPADDTRNLGDLILEEDE